MFHSHVTMNVCNRNYLISKTITCCIIVWTLGVCFGDETVGVPGNVTVVGMFQVQRPVDGQCDAVVVDSVMAAEAIKWYIGAVNGAGRLPFTVGFEAIKTCRVEGKAGEAAVSLTNRVIQKSTDEIIVGVIGPEYNWEMETVSEVLHSVRTNKQLLQVTYFASAERLHDRTLFPNIYHVVPSDDTQIEVMIQTMKSLEWNRIAVIHEDNVYDGNRVNMLRTRADAAEICIALLRAVTVDVSGELSVIELQSVMSDIIYGTTVDGTTTHPIEGVVVFASASTVNFLMSVTNTMGVTSVPIFLLSEATHLDLKVFVEQSGQLLQKTKGSLVISPTYRYVTGFYDHWISLFTNYTIFEREVISNPWLQLVYDHISRCPSDTCQFEPLTEEAMYNHFPQQPMAISYALSAIHTIIKSVYTVHGAMCSENTQLCANFIENFTPSMVLEAMSDLRVNMTGECWSPAIQAGSIPEFSYDASGNLLTQANTPTYQLYNYRRQTQNQEFGLAKVGVYIDGVLNVDKTMIRDYDADGNEREWPDIRKAECSPGQQCSECIRNHLADQYWHIPGDVYVVGIVPVNNKVLPLDCGGIRPLNGYQIAESLLFAVQKFNDNNGIYASYFQDLNIGLIILNTCNNPLVAQRKILNLEKDGLLLDSGEYLDLSGRIVGYVGGVSSTVSIAASHMITPLKHVQISHSATSPALSDRDEHPYFMRVVTPDSSQANAMMLLVQKLNGNYIQIIYSQGAYGEAGKEKVREEAKSMKICVANSIMVAESPTHDYNEYYERLRKNPFAKIVIIVLQSHMFRPFFSDLAHHMERGDFRFIGSEAWGKQPMVLSDDASHNLLGSLTVALEISHNQELENQLRQMKPVDLDVSPWARTYLQTIRGCYVSTSFVKSFGEECTAADSIQSDPDFVPDPWASSAYNSMLSLLVGAGWFFRQVCGDTATSLCSDFVNDPSGLVKEIVSKVKLDIHGDGNQVKVFDDNGDGTVGYNIYNVHRDEDNPQNLVYRKVGQYPLDGPFVLNTDFIVNPVDGEYESRCPNEQACVECLGGENGGTAGGGGLTGESDSLTVIVLSVLFAVAVVTIVIMAIFIWRKFRQPEPDIYLTPDPGMQRTETPGGHTTPPDSMGSLDPPKGHKMRTTNM